MRNNNRIKTTKTKEAWDMPLFDSMTKFREALITPVRNMPKESRFSEGESLFRYLSEALVFFRKAYYERDKAKKAVSIEEMLGKIRDCELLVRMLQNLNLIMRNGYPDLFKHMGDMLIQAKSWQSSVQDSKEQTEGENNINVEY